MKMRKRRRVTIGIRHDMQIAAVLNNLCGVTNLPILKVGAFGFLDRLCLSFKNTKNPLL